MHISGGSKLASEEAAEGVCGLDDGAAPEGSWQLVARLPGIEGVRAQELALHAVHSKRQDLPVSSLVRQSLVLGAIFAFLS